MSSALPFPYDGDENENASANGNDSSSTSSSSSSDSGDYDHANDNDNDSTSVSLSSSFLSPPPSMPSSHDTPLRNSATSRHASPSMLRFVSSPSPVPSLSSTPTGMGDEVLSGSYGSGGARSLSFGNSRSSLPSSSAARRNNNATATGNHANSNSGMMGAFHHLSIQATGNENDPDRSEHQNEHQYDDNQMEDGTGTNNSTHAQGQRIRGERARIIGSTSFPSSSLFSTSPSQTSNTTPNSTSNNSTATTTSSSTTANHNINIGGRVLGLNLGAGMAVGTILRNDGSGRLSALRENDKTATKSDKQRPGQRKQRRWNNDRFVGIASEICMDMARNSNNNNNSSKNYDPQRGLRIANLYAKAEMEKAKYTMPNFPRNYRTIFGTLATVDYHNEEGKTTGGRDRGMHQGHKDLDVDDIHAEGIGAEKVVGLSRRELIRVRQRFVDGEV